LESTVVNQLQSYWDGTRRFDVNMVFNVEICILAHLYQVKVVALKYSFVNFLVEVGKLDV